MRHADHFGLELQPGDKVVVHLRSDQPQRRLEGLPAVVVSLLRSFIMVELEFRSTRLRMLFAGVDLVHITNLERWRKEQLAKARRLARRRAVERVEFPGLNLEASA